MTYGRLTGADLTGYRAGAADGSIGKADKHSDEAGSACTVADTGPWIFSREVLLPAGTVSRVDADDNKTFVDRTKEQIKNAPEFDTDKHLGNAEYHSQVGGYYNGQHRI
ncbi:PRC-barrel domain containing protein [Streptomyces goshikiensis]